MQNIWLQKQNRFKLKKQKIVRQNRFESKQWKFAKLKRFSRQLKQSESDWQIDEWIIAQHLRLLWHKLGSDTDSQSKNCEAKQTYKDVSENYKAIRLQSKNRSKKGAREILLFKTRTKGNICKLVLVSHIFPFNRIFFTKGSLAHHFGMLHLFQ